MINLKIRIISNFLISAESKEGAEGAEPGVFAKKFSGRPGSKLAAHCH